MTRKGYYHMILTLLDVDGVVKIAEYDTFRVKTEDTYELELDGFSTNNNWFVPDSLWINNNSFSTMGSDNDASVGECAASGGGW